MASASHDLHSDPEDNENITEQVVHKEPDSPLQYAAVGAYKSKTVLVVEIRAETLRDHNDGAARLVKLKEKVNELQRHRQSYWKKMGFNAATLAPAVVLSAGVGVVLTPVAAAYMSRRLGQLKGVIRASIGQVNKLRDAFADSLTSEVWQKAEAEVTIVEDTFKSRWSGIKREELKGPL